MWLLKSHSISLRFLKVAEPARKNETQMYEKIFVSFQ